MAIERNITDDDDFFLAEDKTLTFTVYQADGVTPQNITAWTISWMLKRKATDADANAKITKSATLTTPASGICTVTVEDSDTENLAADVYRHELKRTDAGFETVLTFGSCELRQAVHR